MAPKKKRRGSNAPSLPKGVRVNYKTGGTVEEIKSSLRSGNAAMLYLKDDEEVTVVFLAMPDKFPRFGQHTFKGVNQQGANQWTSGPCTGTDTCPLCKMLDSPPSTVLYAPVYNVQTKKMQFFRCNGRTYNDFLAKSGLDPKNKRRRNRWRKKQWAISRQGTGTDTLYSLDVEDDDAPENMKFKKVDIQDILDTQLAYALRAAGNLSQDDDDDDEDDWGGYNEEDTDDDEDDDDDEEYDDDDDDTPPWDTEEDDDDEDDDDEEEEDDEEEDEPPPRKKRKPSGKKSSKKKPAKKRKRRRE